MDFMEAVRRVEGEKYSNVPPKITDPRDITQFARLVDWKRLHPNYEQKGRICTGGQRQI